MTTLSRRAFLRSATASAGLLVGGHLLAACNVAPANRVSTSTVIPALDTATPAITARTVTARTVTTVTPTPAAQAIASSRNAMGTARGIHPGRVVWAHHPQATGWDGSTGYWWQEQNIDQGAVSEMLSSAVRELTGQHGDAQAWDALFGHFNTARGRPGAAYQAGEKIAVKVNLNAVDSHGYKDNGSFTSPQLVYAVLEQLIGAGVRASDITVYDAIRYMPGCIVEHCDSPVLKGVHFVDWIGGDGREAYVRDTRDTIHWSEDVEGNPTYLPTCVTEATYLINLASLKGHNLAGMTACAKNHFGTILSDLDGKPTQQAPQGANIHGTVAAHDYGWGDPAWTWMQRPMGSYNALVDLMAHPHLGEKTVLFMLDGLYVAPHQSAKVTADSRWRSAPFNNHWTSSLFVSQDNVAIDSVALDFLRAEPTIAQQPDVLPAGSTCDNYLHEAALIGQPPSHTAYVAAGEGLASLGAHEHWDDAASRRYSRNRGLGEGIELVQLS